MTAFDGASVLREDVMTDTAVLEEYIADYDELIETYEELAA